MKLSLLLIMLVFCQLLNAQPNCNVFLSEGDTALYNACKYVEKNRGQYYQFDFRFQAMYDEALQICYRFAYAYRAKSVAYLKSGDFLTWKQLIDKAVQYDEITNLEYRAWCRYQFFRDIEGALRDIERLEVIASGDIGYSANGDYHLSVAKAMCYDELGQTAKAIEIMHENLQNPTYTVGLFDYYQLGAFYNKTGDKELAIKYFLLQTEQKWLAETEYFLAKLYKEKGNTTAAEKHRVAAFDFYDKGYVMLDPYTHHANKVYREDLARDLNW